MAPVRSGDKCSASRIIWWPNSVVRVMAQAIWRVRIADVKEEKGSGSSSPYCGSRRSQAMVLPSSRGGVPVFNLPTAKPLFLKRVDNPSAGGSSIRPAGKRSSPIWIMPAKNVPVVSTTAPDRMVSRVVTIPSTAPSLIRRSSTAASTTKRFDICETA